MQTVNRAVVEKPAKTHDQNIKKLNLGTCSDQN